MLWKVYWMLKPKQKYPRTVDFQLQRVNMRRTSFSKFNTVTKRRIKLTKLIWPNDKIVTLNSVKAYAIAFDGLYGLLVQRKKTDSYCSEGFLCRTTARTRRNHLQNIKPYSLGQGPALPNDNMIPFLDTETGWNMGWYVRMSLLIPLIFLDKMEIVPTDNNCPCHFSTVTCSS